MTNPHVHSLLIAAALVLIAVHLGGCPDARKLDGQRVLFDAQKPAKSMFHVDVADDPFAPAAPSDSCPTGPVKVLQGGPLSDKEPYANKATFVDDRGFFVMPATGQASLVLIVGTRGITDLKVEVWAKDPKAGHKFRHTLPAAGRWHELILPLDPAVFKPGCVVNDITVFQVGKDKAAKLYVKSVSLKTN